MLTRLQCRVRAHDSARYVRILEEGNPFALSNAINRLREFEEAYLSPECEASVAQKIKANMDLIETHIA